MLLKAGFRYEKPPHEVRCCEISCTVAIFKTIAGRFRRPGRVRLSRRPAKKPKEVLEIDFVDKLAFFGRRYERQVCHRSGNNRFSLSDVLELFDRNTILELTPVVGGKPLETVVPDPERKIKVSLLDKGISAIHSDAGDWFEVLRTAPSGDLTKVRIVVYTANNNRAGEIAMIVSQRMPAFYFAEDPILQHVAHQ